MPLIKQLVRGQSRTNDLVISLADFAPIQALMEGEISLFDEKSMGGVDVATPATLRVIKLGVNRKFDKLSATVNLKHVKATKSLSELFADKALFDADYVSTLPATGIRAIYEGSK